MATIAIVGVGAIGGTMAAHLYQANDEHEIVLCVRERFATLHLQYPEGEVVAKPKVMTHPFEGTVVDWVLFATKAHQTVAATPWVKSLCDNNTRVAVLQNGVEQVDRLRPFVAAGQILPVVIDCPAVRVKPGFILQKGDANLTVEDSENGQDFKQLFSQSAITVTVSDDIKTAMWQKLCVNVAGGAIAALTDQPLAVLHQRGMAELARSLIDECIKVGRCEGANLKDELGAEIVSSMLENSKQSLTSMLVDKRAGKPLEVDARNGAVVRLGKKHGIATPLNEMATVLLATVNSQNLW